jgi:hypothetical protein
MRLRRREATADGSRSSKLIRREVDLVTVQIKPVISPTLTNRELAPLWGSEFITKASTLQEIHHNSSLG